MKRVTRIFGEKERHKDKTYYAYFTTDNTWTTHSKTGYLQAEHLLDIPTWKALGKPKKIRVTISVVE